MRVVDGLQRISTLHSFVRGGLASDARFQLDALEYLLDINGKSYAELAPSWQRRLNNTQLFVHVIDPSTPDTVKFDIFRRINTGGTPLNAQEIRHCMSAQRSRDFLKLLVSLPSFNLATGGALFNHIRMADREVALRFTAFHRFRDEGDYAEYETMDAFLTEATRWIDSVAPDEVLSQFVDDFDSAMRRAHLVFDDHAFRKWTGDATTGRNPINKALFETWSVCLADVSDGYVASRAQAIFDAARDLMSVDERYMSAISTSTGIRARLSTGSRRHARRSAVDHITAHPQSQSVP